MVPKIHEIWDNPLLITIHSLVLQLCIFNLLGWQGVNCSDAFDVCTIFNPCEHGSCSNAVIGSQTDGTDQPYFECECEQGWTGRQCEENINECDQLAPCQNGAACKDNDGSYECICSNDWTG